MVLSSETPGRSWFWTCVEINHHQTVVSKKLPLGCPCWPWWCLYRPRTRLTPPPVGQDTRYRAEACSEITSCNNINTTPSDRQSHIFAANARSVGAKYERFMGFAHSNDCECFIRVCFVDRKSRVPEFIDLCHQIQTSEQGDPTSG